MTVNQLRKILDDYDDTDLVVLSKDSEGNSYSPDYNHASAKYLPSNTYSGELLEEDEDHNKAVKAFVLWPTN